MFELNQNNPEQAASGAATANAAGNTETVQPRVLRLDANNMDVSL
jgi:hypothetical protein